jgi:class 3 adenylate cyclase/tetratricopeptide (TPR) repeat protein
MLSSVSNGVERLTRDVDQWLQRIGLGTYSQLFAENEIDAEVLPDLNEQDLKDLKIPLGHRKKFLKAISLLPSTREPPRLDEKPAEAERRQLSVMFCDMVGSTALSARLDPEELREIVRVYQDVCTKIIARYDGYIAKFLGDGVQVYFGFPQAHENDAERAARAGLAIAEAISAIPTLSLQGEKLAVRVGINTGPVVVGDLIGEGAAEQASVVGETPNVAARLLVLAEPNQVVIGALTHELIGDVIACEDLGSHDIKGIKEPVRAWRVVGEHDSDATLEFQRARHGLQLVGRHEELGLLMRSWQTTKNRHGQIVLIQGEAGIGKSRLAEELRVRVSSEDHSWLAMRCSPYHTNSTLHPVIESLKRVAGWEPTDNAEKRLAKLEQMLRRSGLPIEETIPLYAELLSLPLPGDRFDSPKLSSQERREQTLDALTVWLIDEAERRPVIRVWEDLQWADPTTLELLRQCIDQSPTVSMMNVLTYRPEFVPPWPTRSHMTPITLNRMERNEVANLIIQQADGTTVPPDVIEYIVEKTDGVPLYVEELTTAILESDFLQVKDGAYQLTRPLSGLSIPATLQDLLMARLDRLPSIREVAQLGSILGREFAYDMLKAIGSLEEITLHNGLDRLVDAELLYQRGRWPRAKYTFKHALLQDAAYQSLLKRTRQYYHRQVGHLLEDRYPEIVESQPELVAHHYARSDESEKAVHYLGSYAELAATKYAHAEAITAIEEACHYAQLLSPDDRDDRILALIVRQAQSLHFLGRRQEIVELLHKHHEKIDRSGNGSLVAEYYFWLGFAHGWLGHRAEADQTLSLGLKEAERVGDEAIAGRVHRALATEFVYAGRALDEAIAHGRRAVTLLERTDDRFWLSQALFTLSYCCTFAGDFDSALEAATRLEAFGDAAGMRRAQANALMLAGLSHATRGDGKAGIELCERAHAISPDMFETAFILACLGKSRLEAGDTAGAVVDLEEAVRLADQRRSLQFRAWFRTMLGEAYASSGQVGKAVEVAREALDTSIGIQFSIGVGLAKQVLGRAALIQQDFAAAKAELSGAAETLASVQAQFELARTKLELAKSIHTQGDGESAVIQLRDARQLFEVLRAPKYALYTDQLATRLGIPSSTTNDLH